MVLDFDGAPTHVTYRAAGCSCELRASSVITPGTTSAAAGGVFPPCDAVDPVDALFGHSEQEVIMKANARIIAAASILSVVGIAFSVWPLVTAGTLAACGTLLLALLRYFDQLPA